MIYYTATDNNGLASIQSIVTKHQKEIEVFQVRSYEAWDRYTDEILTRVKPGDLFVLDTITLFSELTRTDLHIGNQNQALWNMRAKISKGGDYGNDYSTTAQLIMRKLLNLQHVGANILVTAHETNQEDADEGLALKKRGPDVHKKFFTNLRGSSSDIGKLRIVNEDEFNGETLKFKKGQRILEFGPSDLFIGKTQVDFLSKSKVPSQIVYPSYPKVCKALGKVPVFLVVYGPPGVGKTVFCVSSVLDPEGKGLGVPANTSNTENTSNTTQESKEGS